MIGNDVVDLELAAQQSNWRRKGFLKKVFSKTEQEIITISKDPDLAVWLLWSMKEAAYKAHQREFSFPRRLNWLAQQCVLTGLDKKSASGEVTINGNLYFTTSQITSEYVYTSAEKVPNSGAKNVIFKGTSSEARKRLVQEVSSVLKVDAGQLQLKKDTFGMPFFSSNNHFLFDRFSLSGHGRFSAFILSLINCETRVKQS